jgi:hypothetical protein
MNVVNILVWMNVVLVRTFGNKLKLYLLLRL